MRTIKFRAWIDDEMVYDGNSDIKIYLNGAVSQDGVWITSDVQIMQFTGLLDKNGKEIWEGDLLNYEEYTNEVYQVQWNGTDCGWQAWRKIGFISLGIHVAEKIEVIGNIYETPELLNH